MSTYSRIKKGLPITYVNKEDTPFYMSNTNEGFESLIFQGSEILYDDGGHKFTFYPNGVLLSLKENCRFHEGSKSFIFFNNNGKQVLDVYNSSRETGPKKDIEVTIYSGHILVKETDLNDHSEKEYFISVKTGEKILDIGNEEQANLTR